MKNSEQISRRTMRGRRGHAEAFALGKGGRNKLGIGGKIHLAKAQCLWKIGGYETRDNITNHNSKVSEKKKPELSKNWRRSLDSDFENWWGGGGGGGGGWGCNE